jgi:hypothetical protein
MKKTVYFNSQQRSPSLPVHQIEEAITAATNLRDEFLILNSELIAKIDDEHIQFVKWGNDGYIIAVIKLTYYPK